jgi:predicted metal-dependent phosphoesterase TrpH
MGKADLHIHTTYSDGMGTVTAVLEAASRTDLDVIAITDHNEVRGALEAVQLGPRYGIQVIPGSEITTRSGHLLGLFLERKVPAGLTLRDTVLRVAEQGGICIAAHPTAAWVTSLSAASIIWALTDPDVPRTLVGLEVYNAGLPYLANNRRAQALGEATGLAPVASSDSHLLWTIGLCATRFPGGTPAQLRHALEQKATTLFVQDRPFRFFSSWLRGKLLRLAGFGYWSPEPGGETVLRRLSSVQL